MLVRCTRNHGWNRESVILCVLCCTSARRRSKGKEEEGSLQMFSVAWDVTELGHVTWQAPDQRPFSIAIALFRAVLWFFFLIFLTISTCRFHKYFPNSPGVTLIGPSSVWIRRALLPILSQVTNLTVYATVPQMVNSHFSSGRKKDAAFSRVFFIFFLFKSFSSVLKLMVIHEVKCFPFLW